MTAPLQLFNTAKDLRLFYENSILSGDTPDPNETYVLFNQIKDFIEDLYTLKIAEAVDTTQRANVGDSYLSMKSLPSDFRAFVRMVLTNASGGSLQVPYYEVPFSQREKYQKTMRKFYIDIKNAQYGLCGSVSTQMIINFYYRAYTGQMSVGHENDTNPIAWPARFWNIIAFGAGMIKKGNFDADAMNFRKSIEDSSTFEMLLAPLLAWDADLKLADIGGQTGYADEYQEDDNNGIYPTSVGLL